MNFIEFRENITWKVNVRQTELASLIKAAESLRVKGLAVPDDDVTPQKTRKSDKREAVSVVAPKRKRKDNSPAENSPNGDQVTKFSD